MLCVGNREQNLLQFIKWEENIGAVTGDVLRKVCNLTAADREISISLLAEDNTTHMGMRQIVEVGEEVQRETAWRQCCCLGGETRPAEQNIGAACCL